MGTHSQREWNRRLISVKYPLWCIFKTGNTEVTKLPSASSKMHQTSLNNSKKFPINIQNPASQKAETEREMRERRNWTVKDLILKDMNGEESNTIPVFFTKGNFVRLLVECSNERRLPEMT